MVEGFKTNEEILHQNKLDRKKEEKRKEEYGFQLLQRMKLLEKERGPIIQLRSDKEYFELIVNEERPYDVVMLTNLLPEESMERCKHCLKFEELLPQVHLTFDQIKEDRQVFFCTLYIDRDNQGLMDAFEHTGYGIVPLLSVSTNRQKVNDKKVFGYGTFFEKSKEYTINPDDNPRVVDLVNFVNGALKTDVKVKQELSQLLY